MYNVAVSRRKPITSNSSPPALLLLLRLLCMVFEGVCMGTAFRNVRAPQGLGLYPLIVVPSVARETVRLLRHPEGEPALFPACVR